MRQAAMLLLLPAALSAQDDIKRDAHEMHRLHTDPKAYIGALEDVAIARGSLGNPWIFRDTMAFLEKGVIPERPNLDELTDTMLRHLNLNCDFYGDKRGVILFRKLFAWYVKGLHEVRQLKDRAFKAETREEMQSLMESVRTYAYSHQEGHYEGFALTC